MSVVYSVKSICDWCGREAWTWTVEREVGSNPHIPSDVQGLYTFDYYESNGYIVIGAKAEVCKDCVTEFTKWLKQRRESMAEVR